MAVATTTPPVSEGETRPNRTLEFLRFAIGYWQGDKRREAWLLTGVVFALVIANLLVNVGLNQWNRWFFDALEKKNAEALLHAAWMFIGLIVSGAVFAVLMVRFRMTLQLRWRQWVTLRLFGWWLDDQRYYRLSIVDQEHTSPEYRIADDARIATEPIVELGIGFLNAFLSAVTFASILLTVGGSLAVDVFGLSIVIPGYLAIAVILYAAALSFATWRIGQPLVDRVAAKNEAEAQYRYELTRLRENAESIALIKGDSDERERVAETFGTVAARWLDVIKQHCRLTWILNSNTFFAPVLPVLLATPKFLTGELTLGGVMQIAAAFVAVLTALNWFVENYIRLAEWSASACRVDELRDALEELDDAVGEGEDVIAVEASPDRNIYFDSLSVAHQSGRVLIAESDAKIEPGQRVLLAGESGTGKSTLVRAIAGLWPWGSGRVLIPPDSKLAFLPQRPYLPLGTLRDAATYPVARKDVTDEIVAEALQKVGLGYLAKRADDEESWDQILSGGERQRVAFARLLIQRPDIVVMDEATSALDEDSQAKLLELVITELPEATIISVGHRPALEEFHDRKLMLERRPAGARLSSKHLRNSRWRSLSWFGRRSKGEPEVAG